MFDNPHGIRFIKETTMAQRYQRGWPKKGKARSRRNLGVVLPHYSKI